MRMPVMKHKKILEQYGLDKANTLIEIIGNGLINYTWKITVSGNRYILQQVNTNVFTKPEWIAENIQQIKRYLSEQYPSYLFVAPLLTVHGDSFVKDNDNKHFRLFPFVENSYTITTVSNTKQAFEAAKQFGKFTSVLSGFDAAQLHITLPDFHNLSLRFQQFEEAVKKADKVTLEQASFLIDDVYKQQDIVVKYEAIVSDKLIPLRVCHHDTKISNVLLDKNDNGLCVIDLDTVMPGYIISDVGDMLRTYLSPYNEEETDMSKISVRTDYFAAIIKGYISEMDSLLTATEKELLIYSGRFMMYMQAVRFLADFLYGNVYYQTTYPLQNLYRAQNQLTLLQRFTEAEDELQKLIEQ